MTGPALPHRDSCVPADSGTHTLGLPGLDLHVDFDARIAAH